MENDLVIPKKPDKRKITLSRIKRRVLKHIWLVRFAAIIAFLLASLFLISTLLFVITKSVSSNYLKVAYDFIFTPEQDLISLDGRTNILILGKGGDGHEAPDLTDTMIFASVAHPVETSRNNTSLTLISLPRDLWITELRAKLNSVYYWGNKKQSESRRMDTQTVKGGLVLAKSVVEEVTGQPIAYAVVVDFSAFKEAVDVIGGIEVEVDRSFTDNFYPIPGREDDLCGGDPKFQCRYETVRFEKGLQYMDGETALKFVRSRRAEGDEGTDIAREQRQHKVIGAIKNKILSWDVILSPKKIRRLIGVFNDSTETDIDMFAAAILTRRLLQAKDNTNSYLIPEELLLNPPASPEYDNLYVFVPKSQDWNGIHNWIKEKLQVD